MSLIYTGANIMAISLVTGTIRCIVGVSFHYDVEQFLMRIPNLFLFQRWVTNTSLIHSNEMTEVCFVLSECPDSYAEVIKQQHFLSYYYRELQTSEFNVSDL